ncbi:MAG: DUF4386 family protein [Acidimicrobiia bacterium]
MAISSQVHTTAMRAASIHHGESTPSSESAERQLSRWGGRAGLAGVVSMFATVGVVVGLGLPDASEVETLTDFSNIESGRIAEHFLYLGALMFFALHVLVLHRLLRTVHAPAALFGTAVAEFGLVIMAASSLLHVSTKPLADLYTAADTTAEDLRSIEYAWHAAQSVFDTMLATGVLLVPIGITLFGVAMWNAPAFGRRLAQVSLGLGILGTIGAAIEIFVPGSGFSAAAVLAIVVFHLVTGWRTLKLGYDRNIDLSDTKPISVG